MHHSQEYNFANQTYLQQARHVSLQICARQGFWHMLVSAASNMPQAVLSTSLQCPCTSGGSKAKYKETDTRNCYTGFMNNNVNITNYTSLGTHFDNT